MTYKTILAVIQGSEDVDRVLDCALALATLHGAHVIGVHSEPIPVPYVPPMGFPATDFSVANAEASGKRSAEIKARFEARTAREGTSCEWHDVESISGDSAVGALSIAHTCDLVVVQQVNPQEASSALANVEALLFES